MSAMEPAPGRPSPPPGTEPPVIPYGHQSIDPTDVEAVTAVLTSDRLTQGPEIERFEAGLVAATGARHAVAFCNGTAALHAACAVAGLGPSDTVATSSLSFVASANCIRYVGATPRFVDIERATLNLDPTAVPDGMAGLVAVHFAGLPVDLRRLAHRPPVIIEDAAHALGARTPDGPVGNCARSEMCCFSFHPVKTITTGEGGAVTTNDPELAARLRAFRNHQMVRRPGMAGWEYDVVGLGWNYRMTDLQAALGHSQLARLGRFVARRGELARRYREDLAGMPVGLPPAAGEGFTHAYHLFAVRVADRRRVYDELRARGIGVQVHYVPIHHHSAFGGPARRSDLPETDAAYEGLLSLPLYPDLTDADQDAVVTALKEVL
jgi:dTDP-4-amino-4,6-dideoxygalactose transaminase